MTFTKRLENIVAIQADVVAGRNRVWADIPGVGYKQFISRALRDEFDREPVILISNEKPIPAVACVASRCATRVRSQWAIDQVCRLHAFSGMLPASGPVRYPVTVQLVRFLRRIQYGEPLIAALPRRAAALCATPILGAAFAANLKPGFLAPIKTGCNRSSSRQHGKLAADVLGEIGNAIEMACSFCAFSATNLTQNLASWLPTKNAYWPTQAARSSATLIGIKRAFDQIPSVLDVIGNLVMIRSA